METSSKAMFRPVRARSKQQMLPLKVHCLLQRRTSLLALLLHVLTWIRIKLMPGKSKAQSGTSKMLADRVMAPLTPVTNSVHLTVHMRGIDQQVRAVREVSDNGVVDRVIKPSQVHLV